MKAETHGVDCGRVADPPLTISLSNVGNLTRHSASSTRTEIITKIMRLFIGTSPEARTFGDFRRNGRSNASPFVTIVSMSSLVLRSDAWQ